MHTQFIDLSKYGSSGLYTNVARLVCWSQKRNVCISPHCKFCVNSHVCSFDVFIRIIYPWSIFHYCIRTAFDVFYIFMFVHVFYIEKLFLWMWHNWFLFYNYWCIFINKNVNFYSLKKYIITIQPYLHCLCILAQLDIYNLLDEDFLRTISNSVLLNIT